MSEAAPVHGRSKSLVLAAMIFAVAMTFIDQTIVSIAVPQIQTKLGLSATGVQWAVNAYLLALASLFAFGGRLADTLGHRRMVTWGVIIFAGASALCGATPKGGLAEAWLIAFRALQGLGGAIMFPAALAIVVQTYEVRERGKALATFFGIAGALTAVGPIMGGFLTAWTWRAIFWVNLPIAAIAVLLIALSKPETDYRPARMDYRGLALITAGIVLGVFGFQQAPLWGWSNPAIGICIAAGLALLVVFYRVEVRTEAPLIDMNIFRNRTFLVENLVLGIAMLTFVPLFVFSSEYAQISLGKQAKDAGVFLLFFFVGFAVATQVGGRLLDKVGAKLPVTLGCAVAAVGFFLWAGKVTTLDFGKQQWFIVVAGAGMGLMLSPANTDAVNQAGRFSYGEATGITQTIRNYAASLGLAVLGTTLVSRMRTNVANQLVVDPDYHLPRAAADKAAASLAQMQNSGSSGGGAPDLSKIPHFYQLAFAQSTETIFYAMGGIMAVAAIVAFIGLKAGVQHQEAAEAEAAAAPGLEATA
ncbi:MFS transporter [Catenulispora subtropica]|uniref:MFS transporter n=1 Tax=Catenulispora subtropica TaxID=450798 RepID=A0ABP5EWV1_9ACTN